MDFLNGAKLEKVELEELYQKCQMFDESELRRKDPEYDAVLNRYLDRVAKLGAELTEEQVGQLYACVEDAQECMSFEVMHFLRQGFLLGLSAQLGTVIRDLPIQADLKRHDKTAGA